MAHRGERCVILHGTDPQSGLPVAIKRIFGLDTAVEERLVLFANWVQFARQRPWSLWPQVFDGGFCEEDRSAYLVTHWVQGGGVLRPEAHTTGALVAFVLELLATLEDLSRANQAHLGICRDNLYLSAEGRLLCLGLGTGYLLSPRGVGAPELSSVAGLRAQAWRADLFAVAVTTCELLGAKVERFGAPDPAIEFPARLELDLRGLESLKLVLESALKKQPSLRTASPEVLARALRQAVAAQTPGGGRNLWVSRSSSTPLVLRAHGGTVDPVLLDPKTQPAGPPPRFEAPDFANPTATVRFEVPSEFRPPPPAVSRPETPSPPPAPESPRMRPSPKEPSVAQSGGVSEADRKQNELQGLDQVLLVAPRGDSDARLAPVPVLGPFGEPTDTDLGEVDPSWAKPGSGGLPRWTPPQHLADSLLDTAVGQRVGARRSNRWLTVAAGLLFLLSLVLVVSSLMSLRSGKPGSQPAVRNRNQAAPVEGPVTGAAPGGVALIRPESDAAGDVAGPPEAPEDIASPEALERRLDLLSTAGQPAEALAVLLTNSNTLDEATSTDWLTKLRSEIAALDVESPRISLDTSQQVRYVAGMPLDLYFVTQDDFRLVAVEVFARGEARADFARYRATQVGENSWHVGVPAESHMGGAVWFYARAVDWSGHVAWLASERRPLRIRPRD